MSCRRRTGHFGLYVTSMLAYAVGGTQSQVSTKGEHAISYFWKILSPEKENYTANDRELLCLVYFLKIFRYYFGGSSF